MEFAFATGVSDNGQFSGVIKEGTIDEHGGINYTKSEEIPNGTSFEELVANEILKRAYGMSVEDTKKHLKDDVFESVRKHKNASTKDTPAIEKPEPVKKNINEEPVKIGVTVKELNDDEFIEHIKHRVRINKEFDRFKAIKKKIRESLEGQVYNEHAFNLFVKLHDIEKRGFFNRTEEDNKVISEAIKLYGAA